MNPSAKPRVLLLGTFHMKSTADMLTTEIDDLRSPARQQEIIEVVDRLKAFHPTKLALEIEAKKDEKLNRQYREYCAGRFQLDLHEAHQVGFRLASDLGHERVYGIDWMEKGAGTKGAGEVYEWAKEHQPELFESLFGTLHEQQQQKAAPRRILEMYRECNEPALLNHHHTMYLNMARIGEGDQFIGMEWLIWWYQRNLILFSRLARLAASAEDRVMLIIGASHVQILSQFLKESGLFEVEWGHSYLA